MLSCYALDPNHKLEYMTEEGLTEVKGYLFILSYETGADDFEVSELSGELDSFITKLKSHEGFIPDVCNFWKSTGYSFLKRLGIHLAALRASSANTERIFSALNRIITPDRNRLDLITIGNLIQVRLNNLSLKSVRARTSSQPSGQSPTASTTASEMPMDVDGTGSQAP